MIFAKAIMGRFTGRLRCAVSAPCLRGIDLWKGRQPGSAMTLRNVDLELIIKPVHRETLRANVSKRRLMVDRHGGVEALRDVAEI